MQWNIILIHQFLDKNLSLLFFDKLFPNMKAINSSAFKLWSFKGMLIMSITLAIVKRHQATFFINVIFLDDFDNLAIGRYAIETSVFLYWFFLFLEHGFVVHVGLNRVEFAPRSYLWHPSWIFRSSLEGYAQDCHHFLGVGFKLDFFGFSCLFLDWFFRSWFCGYWFLIGF